MEWIEPIWGWIEPVWGRDLWIAMGFVMLAGIVRGFSGFGAAMMLGPVFAILYSAPQAVATMAGLGTLASLQLLPGALPRTDWREMLPITIMAALAIPLGSMILLSLDPDVMRRVISAAILAMVLVLMTGWRYPVKPGFLGALGTGGLSGLINGATGVGGPPVVLYLLAGPNTAGANRANLISYYVFLNGLTLAALYVQGVVDNHTVTRIVLLLPAQIVSLGMGAWLFHHASDAIYRRIALGLLIAVALFGLVYT
jgi:hypothetical protein